MVWCKVRMWGDEENEEGRRRNRVTYRSRAQVSDMCMKNEMMRKKMLDEKCPVRDDERKRVRVRSKFQERSLDVVRKVPNAYPLEPQ